MRNDVGYSQRLEWSAIPDELGRDISTNIKLFDLIRSAKDHPENHTMLIPEIGSKTIHYKTDEGWKSGPCQQKLMEAFFTDNRLLTDKLPASDSNQSEEFYKGYILGCNFKKSDDLLMYYDACCQSLHKNTVNLVETHCDRQSSLDEPADISAPEMQNHDVQDRDLEMMRLQHDTERMKLERLKLELQLKGKAA